MFSPGRSTLSGHPCPYTTFTIRPLLVNRRSQPCGLAERETAQLVAAAEREDVLRYNAARSVGWSTEELRKVGYREPDKKTRVRKRQRRKISTGNVAASSASANGDAVGVTSDGAPECHNPLTTCG